MYNIKQITNYDLDNADIIQKNITINGEVITYNYKVISESKMGGKPLKLGYCCKEIYNYYPVFLTIGGVEKQFQIGKTGMFEYQPEDWTNLNDPEPEEKTAIVYVSEVKVPSNVLFTLDYVLEV